MRVYAVADGYISRIKISPYGYGKSLYITHSNGFTSVYGHLKSFDGVIADFTRAVQYALSESEIDTLLSPDKIPVKKGQLIALSGNTGGSQGPHLHFEIRETATEKPVNPYFLGYKIDDNVKPKISMIAVYPVGETASVNGKHLVKKIKPAVLNGNYVVNKIDSITVNGAIGFGIEGYDTESRSNGHNGIFSIELQSGGRRIYYHEMEKFSFENARYVNAHIDYEEKQKHNNTIQKCFLSKNNQLGIYKNVVNNGIINFMDDSVHWIRYVLKDYQGNTTELMLKVRSSSKTKVIAPLLSKDALLFDCLKENKFTESDISISIPPNALYDDIVFKYTKLPGTKGGMSAIHKILSADVALQRFYTLSIRPESLPDTLGSKACIVKVNDKGGKSYEGGSYKDGWVTTLTKNLGNFMVTVDTTAPKIKTAFKYIPKTTVDLRHAKFINVIATDNLSGIKKYSAKIDGKWVLCEYEFKKDLLYYTFDDTLEKRVHTFEITVTDDKGNASTLLFSFRR